MRCDRKTREQILCETEATPIKPANFGFLPLNPDSSLQIQVCAGTTYLRGEHSVLIHGDELSKYKLRPTWLVPSQISRRLSRFLRTYPHSGS